MSRLAVPSLNPSVLRLLAWPILLRRLDVVEPAHRPVQDERVAVCMHQLAKGVHDRIGPIGRDLHQHVAMGPLWYEAVVDEKGHLDEFDRLAVCQPVPAVKQRCSDADRDRRALGGLIAHDACRRAVVSRGQRR